MLQKMKKLIRKGRYMMELKLASPKVIHYRRIKALFQEDPDIVVAHNDDYTQIDLYVNGTSKAEALEKVLIPEQTFGNETVNIRVVPSNREETYADTLRYAFTGNPIVEEIHVSEGPVLEGACYVVFRKEVVQYPDDNIGDLHGIHSTLYQYIAEKVLRQPEGVFYNTGI